MQITFSNYHLFILTIILIYFICISIEYGTTNEERRTIRWCVINEAESQKCYAMSDAFEQLREEKMIELDVQINCTKIYESKLHCIEAIQRKEADLLSIEPGHMYIAGKFHYLVAISQESISDQYLVNEKIPGYYSVAVVHKNRPIDKCLRKIRSCHSGVWTAGGWIYPMARLIQNNCLNIVDCNNIIRSAASHFDDMCAPDSLSNIFNPMGNNPSSTCKLCKGRVGSSFCSSTYNEPYYDDIGAFRCLTRNDSDIAFMNYEILIRLKDDVNLQEKLKFNGTDFSRYELLCVNGRRVNLLDVHKCFWGITQPNFIVTSYDTPSSRQKLYRETLQLLVKYFGENSDRNFNLFSSIQYQDDDENSFINLLFHDTSNNIVDLGSLFVYNKVLSKALLNDLSSMASCEISQISWCTTSYYAQRKCEEMSEIFNEKNIKPSIDCQQIGVDAIDCIKRVRDGVADVITVDAADAYVAEKRFDLKPVARELYIDDSEFYVVVIARREDLATNVFNLRGKRLCAPSSSSLGGWYVFLNYLIERQEIYLQDDFECSIGKAAGEYFDRSCVPGILSNNYNPFGTNSRSLCSQCRSKGGDYCHRSQRELYYGYRGAFRCLAEMKGDIAITRHDTIRPNTDGRNSEEWARNLRALDFELICPNGRRRNYSEYRECNFGKIPGKFVMMARNISVASIAHTWNLLAYGQQYFGSKLKDKFGMFNSPLAYPDLMFDDSTTRLISIDRSATIAQMLNRSHITLIESLDEQFCSSAILISFSFSSILLQIILLLL
ncbi:hypothetical protein SNEBB_007033 [Seison nebaliae]|nr:hypothetical protein SNEBB_007033 [Seison nebaliae]